MSKSVNQKELFSEDHTIYWPEKYEPVVEYLKNGTSNSENPNSLYKLNVHVIVLAACVGFSHKEKIVVQEKDKKKEIPLSVFHNNDLSIFIYIIALLSSPELNISFLKNIDGEKLAIKIFEQYAAAGLEILYDKYTKGFADPPFLFVSDLIRLDLSSSGNVNTLPPEEEIQLF
jgi:dnd system-associated protein 4